MGQSLTIELRSWAGASWSVQHFGTTVVLAGGGGAVVVGGGGDGGGAVVVGGGGDDGGADVVGGGDVVVMGGDDVVVFVTNASRLLIALSIDTASGRVDIVAARVSS